MSKSTDAVFSNKVREYINRALSGESVLIPTNDKNKYKLQIKFLDLKDELEITEYKKGLTLKKKNDDKTRITGEN